MSVKNVNELTVMLERQEIQNKIVIMTGDENSIMTRDNTTRTTKMRNKTKCRNNFSYLFRSNYFCLALLFHFFFSMFSSSTYFIIPSVKAAANENEKNDG